MREPIEGRLRRFVDAAVGQSFLWGVNDCTRWSADWAEQILERSLNLPAYASEEEARAMMKAAGSLEALWSDRLAQEGIHESYDPKCGDVAVIKHKSGQIGAIMAHGGIALVRHETGVTCLRPREIIKAWSLV